jgi:thiamine-phosphate pyrophosphorylase
MFPRFYPILDAGLVAKRGISVADCAQAFCDAGVKLLQYRDKQAMPHEILANAAIIQNIFAGTGCTLILNDHAYLAAHAAWHGVHIGQQDMSPAEVRATMGAIMGAGAIIGLSTHNGTQVLEGDATFERVGGPGYLAIGPVFATGSKENPEPVVGLEGVRRARGLTKLPLVAIGGITRENALSVMAAGADTVAVISDAVGRDAAETRMRCVEWIALLGS